MDVSGQYSAWLEGVAGALVPIQSTCSVGRSKSNMLVLDGDRISRRHALIHRQSNEYWLVDCGSANGTRLNGRRVTIPQSLRDGDEIEMGGIRFRFRVKEADYTRGVTGAQTEREVKTADCWLLLTDIVASTKLVNSKPAEELASILGKWFLDCREKIEAHGGAINKYLGDGLLAIWFQDDTIDGKVVQALNDLKQLQDASVQPFRIVVHFGSVSIGGVPGQNEDSLFGPEVHYIFRIEKVAGALNALRCLSEPAAARLRDRMPVESLGSHRVQGFAEPRPLFAFQ